MKQDKLRILAVEDNPADFRLLEEYLKEGLLENFELVQAKTTKEALKFSSAEKFDIILLDLGLPDSIGLDGLERVYSHNPSVPIIVLTGFGDEETGVRALQKNAQDYLVKGQVKPDLLIKSIRYSIQRKHQEAALEEARRNLEVKVEERTEELMQANRRLSKEVLERKEIERAVRVRSSILKIMQKAATRKEFLDILVRFIKGLTHCRYCGIRVLNEEGDIPYESYTGFSRAFWEKENWLSLSRDQCACIRVVTGQALPQDKPCMSAGGSFVANDALEFVKRLSREEKALFRGACMQSGFHSVAAVPIRYKKDVIAAIHIADERKNMLPAALIEFIELLTPLFGEAIHKFEIEDGIRQSHIGQNIINKLIRYSFEGADIEKILMRSLELLFSLTWLAVESRGGVYLADDGEANTLLLKAQKNLPEFVLKTCAKIPFGKCLCGKAAKDKKIHFADSLDTSHEVTHEGMPEHGHYCVPIMSGEKLLGVMNLYLAKDYRRDFKKEEFLITVSNALAAIIQRKQYEKKLRATQAELERSRRLSDIGTLAATVAHELRNPLAAISMASFNIKRKTQNPLLEKHFINIEKKVSESDQIINNLLFYSRLKEPHYESVDLYKIIDECLEIAKRRAAGNKITIRREYRALRNFPIEADSLQMKELFGNILNNAYDAMHGNPGTIEIGATRDKDSSVMIYIKDSGVGMNEEHLKRAHEPFFTTKAKGTGLGLTVCFQIINLHEGKIELASQEGKGTTVTVALPIKRG